jgi:hypothetical protein
MLMVKHADCDVFINLDGENEDYNGLPQEATIANRYGLSKARLNLLESDKRQFMGDQEICSFIASISKNVEKEVVVIDPIVMALRGPIISSNNVAFGDLLTFRILIFPIYLPGHWQLDSDNF